VVVIVTAEVESYANSPFEFARAVAPARHSMKPVATSPAARACSVTERAAAARSVGDGIEMMRSFGGGYCCGPSSGIRSGFTGTSLAISLACRAAAASDASSSRFVTTLAVRPPTIAVTVTVVSAFSPLVVTWLIANRVSARTALVMLTRISSATECLRTRLAISSAAARERISTGAYSECGANVLTLSVPC
jgi:hypothetical protein